MENFNHRNDEVGSEFLLKYTLSSFLVTLKLSYNLIIALEFSILSQLSLHATVWMELYVSSTYSQRHGWLKSTNSRKFHSCSVWSKPVIWLKILPFSPPDLHSHSVWHVLGPQIYIYLFNLYFSITFYGVIVRSLCVHALWNQSKSSRRAEIRGKLFKCLLQWARGFQFQLITSGHLVGSFKFLVQKHSFYHLSKLFCWVILILSSYFTSHLRP